MKVDLFVFGVPNGEDYWGPEEDRKYFGNFYDQSNDEVKFFIQTRLSGGKPYCYYNYMVYKSHDSNISNVVAFDGRDGSYFGLSLRFDAYCKDIMNMYRILDTIYNVYIVGDILKKEKSKLKYTIPNFSSVNGKLESIQNYSVQLIQNAFGAEDFTSLDNFTFNIGNVLKCNLYECSNDAVLIAIKQNGGLALSPYYPSNQVIEISNKFKLELEKLKNQHNKELSICEKNKLDLIEKQKTEIQKLKNEYEEKLNICDKAKNDLIVAHKSEIEKVKSDLENKYQLDLEKAKSDLEKIKKERKELISRHNSLEKDYKQLKCKFNKLGSSMSQHDDCSIHSSSHTIIDCLKSWFIFKKTSHEASKTNEDEIECESLSQKNKKTNPFKLWKNGLLILIPILVILIVVLFLLINKDLNMNKMNQNNKHGEVEFKHEEHSIDILANPFSQNQDTGVVNKKTK